MNKKKTFAYIFAGVLAAGVLTVGISFLLRALITGNPIVTIVTLFAIFAGALMAGLGLICMLICLLLLTFSKGGKSKVEQTEVEEQNTSTPEE